MAQRARKLVEQIATMVGASIPAACQDWANTKAAYRFFSNPSVTEFRILTLLDEYTRRCLAMHVGWSIRAVDVITVVEAAMERYGKPGHIRSDNGPEFIAYAIGDWLKAGAVGTIYITPGSPWENA